MNPIFKAIAKSGKLILLNKDLWSQYLSSFKDGEELEIIARKRIKRVPRSDLQNRYYWGCVLILIAEETGYTTDEVHEICKHLFLLKNLQIQESSYIIARSTTDLTTVEMEEYLSKVRQWAAIELAMYIPLPNEVETTNKKEG